MIYKTSLDAFNKWATALVTILFLGIIGSQIFILQNKFTFTSISVILTLALTYIYCLLFRPMNYRVTNDSLIIHRPAKNIIIPLRYIQSAEQIDQATLKWTVRVFGVSGLFGYWGKFANSKIGAMTWYATRRSNGVLIRTITDKKIFLTPDDPASFTTELNAEFRKL